MRKIKKACEFAVNFMALVGFFAVMYGVWIITPA